MRVLKILLYVVFALFAILLLIGLIFPVSYYENSFLIDAPVEKSWDIFMDDNNTKKWLPTLKSIETISGAPKTVGSKFKLTFEEEGELIEMYETMTAIDENERFAFDMSTDIFDGNAAVLFSDENGKTRINAKSEFRGYNVFYRAMLFIMKGSIAKNSDEQYLRLKKIIESSPD